eukprot:g1669.t1
MKDYDSDVEGEVEIDAVRAEMAAEAAKTPPKQEEKLHQEKQWEGTFQNIEDIELSLLRSPQAGPKRGSKTSALLAEPGRMNSNHAKAPSKYSVARVELVEEELERQLFGGDEDEVLGGGNLPMRQVPPKNYDAPSAMGSWFMRGEINISELAMFDDTPIASIRAEAQRKLDEVLPKMDRIYATMAQKTTLSCKLFHPTELFFSEFEQKLEMGDSEDEEKLKAKQSASAIALHVLCLCARYAYAGGEALAEKECENIKTVILSLDPAGVDFVISCRQVLTYVLSYAPMRDHRFELHPLAKVLFSGEQCLSFMETAQLVFTYLRCVAVISLDEDLKDSETIVRKLSSFDNMFDFFRPQCATFFFNAPFTKEDMKSSCDKTEGRWAKLFGKDGCQTKVAQWTNALKKFDFLKAARKEHPEQFAIADQQQEAQRQRPKSQERRSQRSEQHDDVVELNSNGDRLWEEQYERAERAEQERGAAPMEGIEEAQQLASIDPVHDQVLHEFKEQLHWDHPGEEFSVQEGENNSIHVFPKHEGRRRYSAALVNNRLSAELRRRDSESEKRKADEQVARCLALGEDHPTEGRQPQQRQVKFNEEAAAVSNYSFLLPARLAGKNYHQQALLMAGKGAPPPKGPVQPDLQKPAIRGRKAVPVTMEHQMQRLLMGGFDPQCAAKNHSAHPLEYDPSVVSSYELREPVPGETSRVCRPKRPNQGPFSNHHHLIADRGLNEMLVHDGAKMNLAGPLLGGKEAPWPFNQEGQSKTENNNRSRAVSSRDKNPGKGGASFQFHNKHKPTPAEQQVHTKAADLAGEAPDHEIRRGGKEEQDYYNEYFQNRRNYNDEEWADPHGNDWHQDRKGAGHRGRKVEENLDPNYSTINNYNVDRRQPRKSQAGADRNHRRSGTQGCVKTAADEEQERAERLNSAADRLQRAREEREIIEETEREEARLREARRNLIGRERRGEQGRRHNYNERPAECRRRDSTLPDPLAGMTTIKTQVALVVEDQHADLTLYLEEAEHGTHIAPATERDLAIPPNLYHRVGFVYYEREKVVSPMIGRCFNHKIRVYFRARADEQVAEGDFSTPPIESEYLYGVCQRSTIIWFINHFDNGRGDYAAEVLLTLAAQGLMARNGFEKMVDLFIAGEKPKLEQGAFFPLGVPIKKERQEELEGIVSMAISNSGNLYISLKMPSRETHSKLRIGSEKVRRDVLPVSSSHHLDPQSADPKNAKHLVDNFTVCNILTMLTYQVGRCWRGSVELQNSRYADFCQRIHANGARLPALIGRKQKEKFVLEFTDRLEHYQTRNPSVAELIADMIRWLEMVPDAANAPRLPLGNLTAPPAPGLHAPAAPGAGGGKQPKGKEGKGKGKNYYNTWGSGKYQQNYQQNHQGTNWNGYNNFTYGSLPGQQNGYYQSQHQQQHQHQHPNPQIPNITSNKRQREEPAAAAAGGSKYKVGPDGNRTQGSYLVERHRNAIHTKTGVKPEEIQCCRGLCTYHLAARVGITDDAGELVCCPAGDGCKRDPGHKITNGFYEEKCTKGK